MIGRPILVVVLVALIAAVPARAQFGQTTRAPAPPAVSGAQANPLAQQRLDALSATRERPLFSPSRKPPANPAPAPAFIARDTPTPEIPPPSIALFGVVSDPEGVRALIRLPSNQMRRVRVGDEISGWTVSQIEPRRLVLTLDKRTAVFVLFGEKEMREEPPARVQRGELPGKTGQPG